MRLMEKLKSIMETPEDEMDAEDISPAVSGGETGHAAEHTGQKRDKVVSIHTTAALQVYVVKPAQFEDASVIADLLKDMRTIVLNLEDTKRDVAHRLLDFLGGVAYAYNGQIKQIANHTFLVAPYNVELMGNLLDDLQSSGWDLPEKDA